MGADDRDPGAFPGAGQKEEQRCPSSERSGCACAGCSACGTRMSDFDAELESHVAMHTEDGIRAGLAPEEARRQALIRLGGAEQTRQAYRERRDSALARIAPARLRLRPSHTRQTSRRDADRRFSPSASASAPTPPSSPWSAASSCAPRPWAIPRRCSPAHHPRGDQCCNNFSYPDLRRPARPGAILLRRRRLQRADPGFDRRQRRAGARLGPGRNRQLFDVTAASHGAGPRLCRAAKRTRRKSCSEPALWQRRFNADPGHRRARPVTLSGHAFTVVGVVTPAFHGVDQILNAEFWVPLGNAATAGARPPEPEFPRQFHWLQGGRAPRSRASHASRPRRSSTRSPSASHTTNPETDKGNRFVFEQAGTFLPENAETVLIFLAALSVVVLLVLADRRRQRGESAVCAGRQPPARHGRSPGSWSDARPSAAANADREPAARPGRRRAGSSALSVGHAGLSALPFACAGSARCEHRRGLARAAFRFALSVLSGLLLGLAPAWAASRPLLANALKGEDALARPGRRFSLRNLLVVAQIAMSVVLLCVTGLFLRSLESAVHHRHRLSHRQTC